MHAKIKLESLIPFGKVRNFFFCRQKIKLQITGPKLDASSWQFPWKEKKAQQTQKKGPHKMGGERRDQISNKTMIKIYLIYDM